MIKFTLMDELYVSIYAATSKGKPMTKFTLMDELYVSIYAAQGLRPDEYDAIRRPLMKKEFRTRLRYAVRAVLHRNSSLRKLPVKVSR